MRRPAPRWRCGGPIFLKKSPWSAAAKGFFSEPVHGLAVKGESSGIGMAGKMQTAGGPCSLARTCNAAKRQFTLFALTNARGSRLSHEQAAPQHARRVTAAQHGARGQGARAEGAGLRQHAQGGLHHGAQFPARAARHAGRPSKRPVGRLVVRRLAARRSIGSSCPAGRCSGRFAGCCRG